MKQAPSLVSHTSLPLAVCSRMHAGKSHPMATAAIAPVIVCTEKHPLKLLGAEETRNLPNARLLVRYYMECRMAQSVTALLTDSEQD